MANSLVNPYCIRWAKFNDGERMPFLVKRSTGTPLEDATYWMIAHRRILGVQSNTLGNELRGLFFIYLWADARGVDIQQRLAEGVFFSLSEITDLGNFCGLSIEKAVRQTASRSPKVASLQDRRKATKGLSGEKRNRLAAIYSLIEFTSADYLSRLSPWPSRWDHYNSVRSECLKTLDGQRKGGGRRSRDDVGQREGLDEDVLNRLRDVVEPDHSENPFKPEVRFRNYVIIMLLLALGIRRGELCGLKVTDCLFGTKGTVTVHRRPDDPADPRKHKPATKTAARVMPLNPKLVDLVHEWITHHRSKIAGARLHPYLIVSSDTGKPMSLSNVNKIMERLRDAVPGLPVGLTAHILRHSWNDWFSLEMDKKGYSEDEEVKWRMRLMGWRDPDTARHYLRRTVRRRSDEVLREMQDQLTIGVGDREQ
ncbi:site-specific integrase [Rhizobium sp. P38BS-XIX]|uniref:tyrosine-type recombinase/integrase n=1 Tax=Rhizobium sp. P38BS-XIX TaxID=2726740 RepID=UPI001456F34F|nr:site-specific integrase [Rhizobium sp. P38BS-XIX]NLR96056.1 site-specific integrase [Rhizobium sp. P38BS-XIX]